MGQMVYDLGAEQLFERTIKLLGKKLYVVGTSLLTHFYSSYSSSVSVGAMAWWLRYRIPNLGAPCSKPLGDSKLDSVSHPSKVNKMSTRNFR